MGRSKLGFETVEIFYFCFLCDAAVTCLINIVKLEHNPMSPILDLQVVIYHREDEGRSAGSRDEQRR